MNTNEQLEKYIKLILPRILTQVCRNKYSKNFGSFDRNWWHYKIRDFSSIILQQGAYALFESIDFFNENEKGSIKKIILASGKFWNKRACKKGAFEEYYPWEQGYPPLAFSSLAISKLVLNDIIPLSDVYCGLKISSKKLLSEFESEAANQQVAGLAALGVIKKIAPNLVSDSEFENLSNKTLNLQNSEGWFIEYGGPDLGYLSVTIDCLWDLYDITQDDKFFKSLTKAFKFIEKFILLPSKGLGMFNSRNTDYIVPYGITRFLKYDEYYYSAKNVINILFADLDNKNHFLHSIDDRYYCHYIGHSIIRSFKVIYNLNNFDYLVDNKINENFIFDESGYIFNSDSDNLYSRLIAGKKGGIFYLRSNDFECCDFGWVVKKKNILFTSHHWDIEWNIKENPNLVQINGYLKKHEEIVSTPLKHLSLRILSFLFGRKIISFLKEKIIFKSRNKSKIKFERKVQFFKSKVNVTDKIYIDSSFKIFRANRSSIRHVASADSYHYQDLNLLDNKIKRTEVIENESNFVIIDTLYRFKN